MELIRELAARLIREHPERAALVLEQRPTADGVDVLSRAPAADAAKVAQRLSPSRVGALVAGLAPSAAAALLAELDLDSAARVARRLADDVRAAVLRRLDERRARSLEAVLGFREDSAGALMDPEVLALPEGLTVAAALDRIRVEPERARYNLYVVDAEQRLVGAVNLRELLLADPQRALREIMVRRPLHMRALAGRAEVLAHPGWKEVHSLPVVDEAGCYLGALRYRTLRELEGELLARSSADAAPSRALGELLALGAAGALDAFAGMALQGKTTDVR